MKRFLFLSILALLIVIVMGCSTQHEVKTTGRVIHDVRIKLERNKKKKPDAVEARKCPCGVECACGEDCPCCADVGLHPQTHFDSTFIDRAGRARLTWHDSNGQNHEHLLSARQMEALCQAAEKQGE